MDRNAIREAIDAFAREADLVAHSGGWYLTNEEVLAVVEIQKSNYGKQYYINLGFWLCVLGPASFPEERESHIRIRLTSLLPESRATLESLLDLENSISEDDRQTGLRRFMGAEVLPLLRRASTERGLRQLHAEGVLRTAAITGPALEVLTNTGAA